MIKVLCCIVWLFFASSLAANSLQWLEQELAQGPWQDEWIWLDDPQQPGLWQWHRTGNPKGLAIILHPSGQHLDWPDRVRQLRLNLPDNGWATLSIQLRPDQSHEQYRTQIRRALALGAERGFLNTALVGLGSSASQVLAFSQSHNPEQDNFGLYLVLYDIQPVEGIDINQLLGQLQLPILDLYHPNGPGQDVAAHLRRAAAARRQNQGYLQIAEPSPPARTGDGHDRLSRRVWGWLANNASGQEARRAN